MPCKAVTSGCGVTINQGERVNAALAQHKQDYSGSADAPRSTTGHIETRTQAVLFQRCNVT